MLGWALLGAGVVAVTAVVLLEINCDYINLKGIKKIFKKNDIKSGTVKKLVTDGKVTHISLDCLTENGIEKKVVFNTNDYNERQIRLKTRIVTE